MARNYNFRSSVEMRREYVVEITEQPAPKQQRFRYASEVDGSRSVGSIPGVHSTADRRTYPTVRVHGYRGPMVVMLSLVNPEDNLVHPHAITGNDTRYICTNGVIYTFVEGPEVVFNNVGILCVKSKTEEDVKAALRDRQKLNMDPFKAGFPHIDDHRLINFNAVRLCFTVYIPEGELLPQDRKNLIKYNIDLKPVASTIVYDAKKLSELKIQYINKSVGSMHGGTEIVILCEKYTGVNPEVVFVEGEWEEKAKITMYHKQMAVVAISPPYRDPFCTHSVPVEVYLQRVGPRGVIERSAPASSEYIPVPPRSHPSEVGIKRPPPDYLRSKILKKPFKEHLNKFIYTPDAQRNGEMQRAIAQLLQCFDPSPPVGSDYKDGAGMAASTLSNAPVQQDNNYWRQCTYESSNPFSQQMDPTVNHVAPNLYTDVNIATPSYNQNMDTVSPNTISYANTLDPIMPNVQSYASVVHSGPSTSFDANYNNMLANNFTTIQADFSTLLPPQGENMNFENTLNNPMPNIIPTASNSYNQMPDVLLSPMSEDCGSLITESKFEDAVRVDHFNIFNESNIVNPVYENMQNGGALGHPIADDFAANLGFEYNIDTENLSDEFNKKVSF